MAACPVGEANRWVDDLDQAGFPGTLEDLFAVLIETVKVKVAVSIGIGDHYYFFR